MAQPRIEPLSPGEAEEILSAGPKGVLIGGSALAFWVTFFELPPQSALKSGVTMDIDFFGTKRDASAFAASLHSALGCKVETLTPKPDDITVNTAKILLRDFHGRKDAVEIDYLGAMEGFNDQKERRFHSRAFKVDINGAPIRVMHPMDCLLSRVANLVKLPGKRNAAGVAQCHLATQVVNKYLKKLCADGDHRAALIVAEQVAELARSGQLGAYVNAEYGINLLEAVPVADFASERFKNVRWPQIRHRVETANRNAEQARLKRKKVAAKKRASRPKKI